MQQKTKTRHANQCMADFICSSRTLPAKTREEKTKKRGPAAMATRPPSRPCPAQCGAKFSEVLYASRPIFRGLANQSESDCRRALPRVGARCRVTDSVTVSQRGSRRQRHANRVRPRLRHEYREHVYSRRPWRVCCAGASDARTNARAYARAVPRSRQSPLS